MISYLNHTFDDVTDILEARAASMGCLAFSLKGEPMPPEITLDAAGPLSWALVIHGKAIAQLSGITSVLETNAFPFLVSPNTDAPLGNEVVLQPSRLPMAIALNFLDASLEHAICLGMRELGYKPSEWDALPDENKVIPIEPYLLDLQKSWVTEQLEVGDVREQIQSWPSLMDMEALESSDLSHDVSQDIGVNRSRFLKMSSPK